MDRDGGAGAGGGGEGVRGVKCYSTCGGRPSVASCLLKAFNLCLLLIIKVINPQFMLRVESLQCQP